MKRIIALSLVILMTLMCVAACNNGNEGESSSLAESSSASKGESSINESSGVSSLVSDTFSETSQPSIDELNIIYYEGEYNAAANLVTYISGAHEIYSSGIEEYFSENDVADDVYLPVGIRITGAHDDDGVCSNAGADVLPQMFGFVKDPNAKLNLEIFEDYDYEAFVVPFDVVGYVNKSVFEKMQKNKQFGIELTWLRQDFFI